MLVAGTPATAPCDVTAPVAEVRASKTAKVPVAKAMVDAAPVVALLIVKAPVWLSHEQTGSVMVVAVLATRCSVVKI